MPRLKRLNHSLLRSVSRAALGADAPAEDENAEDENIEDEDAPPAGRRGRKSKKSTKSRRSRRSQEDENAEDEEAEDEEAEDQEEEDDLDSEDEEAEDEEAEDDYESEDEEAEDDYESEDEEAEDEEAEDEEAEDEDVPPAGRRGRKSRKSKATRRTSRTSSSRKPVARTAGARDRQRVSAITRSKLAAGREGLADFLAFDTGLSSRTALAILKHSPKARTASTLRSRMASIDNPRTRSGSGRAASDDEKVVQSAVKTSKTFGF